MKIKTQYFLLCENTFADQFNKATIVGVYSNINGGGLPMVGPNLTFAFAMTVQLANKDENIEVDLQVTSPTGKRLIMPGNDWQSLGLKKMLEPQTVAGGMVLQTPVFEEFGLYKVALNVGKNKAGSLEFSVTKVGDESVS